MLDRQVSWCLVFGPLIVTPYSWLACARQKEPIQTCFSKFLKSGSEGLQAFVCLAFEWHIFLLWMAQAEAPAHPKGLPLLDIT